MDGVLLHIIVLLVIRAEEGPDVVETSQIFIYRLLKTPIDPLVVIDC